MAALWAPRSLVVRLLYVHTPFEIEDLCKLDRFPKLENSSINTINQYIRPVLWIGQNGPGQGFTMSNTAVYNDQLSFARFQQPFFLHMH